MKKHLSLLLAALTVLSSIAATSVSAASSHNNEEIAEATYAPAATPIVAALNDEHVDENGIYYTLDLVNGTAVVGKNTYSDSASAVAASIGASVTVPGIVTLDGKSYNVTAVGRNAFDGLQGIKEVVISDGIESIGEFAFAGSTVEVVVLPTSVKTIDGFAFWGCTRLSFIKLSSVSSIGGGAFWGATNLKTVSIGNGVTVMTKAFADSGVTVIHNLAVTVAPSVAADAYPDGVKIIVLEYVGDDAHRFVSGTVVVEPGKTASVPVYYQGLAPGITCDKLTVSTDFGAFEFDNPTIDSTVTFIGYAEFSIPADAADGTYPITMSIPDEEFPFINGSVIVCSHKNTASITTKDHSCDEEGAANLVCIDCGTIVGSTATDPIGSHNYEDFVVNPTCTQCGYTRHICRICGEKHTDTEIDAKGHAFDHGSVDTVPTVSKNGQITYTCATCSYNEKNEIAFGDVDCNGKVDVSDAIYILKAVASWDLSDSAYHAEVADLNANEKIDVSDAIRVLKIVAHWDNLD